jgi:hypothetical protein
MGNETDCWLLFDTEREGCRRQMGQQALFKMLSKAPGGLHFPGTSESAAV